MCASAGSTLSPARGRLYNRLLDLVAAHRQDKLGALAEELANVRVAERTIQEVGPNHHDYAKPLT